MGEHREEEPEELAESLQEPVYEDSYTEDSRRSERRHQQIQVVATVLTNHPAEKDKKPKRNVKIKTKRFFKWLVILLILLFAYSTVMF